MKDNEPVLLVEDDRMDQKSIIRSFRDLNITNFLKTVENGEEALSYLRNKDESFPCLILLDLNMPKMGGIEFLRVVKNDPKLKLIPIVILTTSQEEKDKVESYELGIAGYMLKPIDYKQVMNVISQIHLYWNLSRIPKLTKENRPLG